MNTVGVLFSNFSLIFGKQGDLVQNTNIARLYMDKLVCKKKNFPFCWDKMTSVRLLIPCNYIRVILNSSEWDTMNVLSHLESSGSVTINIFDLNYFYTSTVSIEVKRNAA